MDGLVALLREDAVLSMPPQPGVVGAQQIGAFFTGVRGRHEQLIATATSANGQPAVAIRQRAADGSMLAHRLLVLDVHDGQIAGLHAHGDPALLATFGL